MSRGPGRVERCIAAAFSASPSETFSVEELAAVVYPGVNRVEKKHRVAILRAADKVAADHWWQGRRSEAPGGSIVYRNLCDVTSYTVGLFRTSFPVDTKKEVQRRVSDPNVHRSEWKRVQPGGAFWTHVEINKAERDGRSDEAQAMLAALRAKYDPMLRRVDAVIRANSPPQR